MHNIPSFHLFLLQIHHSSYLFIKLIGSSLFSCCRFGCLCLLHNISCRLLLESLLLQNCCCWNLLLSLNCCSLIKLCICLHRSLLCFFLYLFKCFLLIYHSMLNRRLVSCFLMNIFLNPLHIPPVIIYLIFSISVLDILFIFNLLTSYLLLFNSNFYSNLSLYYYLYLYFKIKNYLILIFFFFIIIIIIFFLCSLLSKNFDYFNSKLFINFNNLFHHLNMTFYSIFLFFNQDQIKFIQIIMIKIFYIFNCLLNFTSLIY
jgi:hypothetical protein